MRSVITLRNGETRTLKGFSGIEEIECNKPLILLLDNEDMLEGYSIDGTVSKMNELFLINEHTGICIGVLITRIIGWCYCNSSNG